MNRDKAHGDLKTWLNTYSSRIQDESSEWESESSRQTAMKGVNPRFVLRQWVLEDVISKVESDPQAGKRILAKVLQMACKPFDLWGGEGVSEGELDEELEAERKYCGLGDTKMLGFQCSCSS